MHTDSVKIIMSDKEKELKDLIESGDIPAIGQITDAQSAILLMLHRQNLNQSETNRTIFTKLDNAADIAKDAKEEAKKAALVGEKAALTGEEVKNQFIALNGRVQKTIERVTSLEGIRELEVKEEEKRALIRQGMRAVPTKLYDFLTVSGQVLLGIVGILSTLATIWWFIKTVLFPSL